MAKMYPENIDIYNPVKSEKIVYNALKEQLDDSISVFYSVSWTTKENDKRKTSEADFVIFDPRYGYITMEVKGGRGIRVDGNNWFLEYENEEGGRKLDRSPYIQAEDSMYYFKDYFRQQYNFPFGGVFGAVVCFPLFSIDNPEKLSNRSAEMTISMNDMNNLAERIRRLFIFFKRNKTRGAVFTKNQQQQFLQLLNKRLQISAAAGALIDYQRPQFEVINRVQDNYVYLLKNYKKFLLSGGAGTGKTWTALKFVKEYESNHLRVLFTCMNEHLVEFIKKEIGPSDYVDVMTFHKLLVNNHVIGESDNIFRLNILDLIDESKINKYDAIVIDEAQDFNVDCAMAINLFLRDESNSRLNVFFDMSQNIFDRDFKEGFNILYPEFNLRENLRNTAKIYNWATKNTHFNTDVITNPIEGTEPVQKEFTTHSNCLDKVSLILQELCIDEGVSNKSIVILVDDEYMDKFTERAIANWKLTPEPVNNNEIKLFTVSDYKGLESDVVIYVHPKNTNATVNYVAYTRARYFLYDLVVK